MQKWCLLDDLLKKWMNNWIGGNPITDLIPMTAMTPIGQNIG